MKFYFLIEAIFTIARTITRNIALTIALTLALTLVLFAGAESFVFAGTTPLKTGPDNTLQIIGLTPSPLTFSTAQLLKSPDLKMVTVKKDPAYDKTTNYLAIPFRSLIKSYVINKEATIEFTCYDGYSSVLDANELLTAPLENQAYLAVSPSPKGPWLLSKEKKAVGPFFLVWPNPKDGRYKEANWPFNLRSFKVTNKSFKEQFPQLYPKLNGVPEAEALRIRAGLESFRTSCFSCHSLNGAGRAAMGIDLIQSGYVSGLNDTKLMEFVRSPGKYMPGTKMNNFSSELLPEKDLENIITYLRRMRLESSEQTKD